MELRSTFCSGPVVQRTETASPAAERVRSANVSPGVPSVEERRRERKYSAPCSRERRHKHTPAASSGPPRGPVSWGPVPSRSRSARKKEPSSRNRGPQGGRGDDSGTLEQYGALTSLVRAATPMWDGLVALVVSVFIFLGAVLQLFWKYVVRRNAPGTATAPAVGTSPQQGSKKAELGSPVVRKARSASSASDDGPRRDSGEEDVDGVAEDADGNPVPVRRGSSVRPVYKEPVRTSRAGGTTVTTPL